MARKGAAEVRSQTRKGLEGEERRILAPYAAKASESHGRVHREPEHPYRTCFQRDRDRIIHSTAFRRLEYKTQVFVIHEGDYYRTRLTHTLEVSQIAGTVARALRLNGDLVEVIALAHDLGHGPFGHSGEDALRAIMEGHGGFDHNLQALRIVDHLEERYPSFPGLNLTWEVRQGLNKHRVPLAGAPHRGMENLSLEAQVVDVADEIAYDNHDIDDGITSGLIREEALEAFDLWRRVRREVTRTFPGIGPEQRKYQVIRRLIDLQVTDLIQESLRRIRGHRIQRPADALAVPERIIDFSRRMKRLRAPIKKFLNGELYHHYKVVRMADKAHRFLTALFEAYLNKPEQLPNTTRRRLAHEEPHRVICDYMAGMTDRYALDDYKKLFLPFEPMGSSSI
ncbi:MAG: deoxyguanosinetriphosphate triphosphohydrolase [Candidatus Omnitrophica bacterium]|nr:deoxyguanosinetriphosphate triphosphohydrolase [Candidatus Omnitrophota bacterium]